MNEITAVVLTKNEEAHIADCLASLAWCDEVMVLDSFSTDRTVEIARELSARVVQHPFENFSAQRNAGIELVNTEWVLFVDADERVSPELADEICSLAGGLEAGWWIPTKNYIFGRWMRHAGMYPDYHLRLLKAGQAHYDPTVKVHERPILEGSAGYLQHALIHLNYTSLSEMLDPTNRYDQMKAEIMYAQGIRPTYHLLAAFPHVFFERFVLQKGYRDGYNGFRWSLMMGYHHFLSYVHLWRLWHQKGKGSIG